MTQRTSTRNTVIRYHNTTKHHLNRYAAGPQALDWDDQTDRRTAGFSLSSLARERFSVATVSVAASRTT